jgi:hypothetical protein
MTPEPTHDKRYRRGVVPASDPEPNPPTLTPEPAGAHMATTNPMDLARRIVTWEGDEASPQVLWVESAVPIAQALIDAEAAARRLADAVERRLSRWHAHPRGKEDEECAVCIVRIRADDLAATLSRLNGETP